MNADDCNKIVVIMCACVYVMWSNGSNDGGHNSRTIDNKWCVVDDRSGNADSSNIYLDATIVMAALFQIHFKMVRDVELSAID